MHNKRWSFFCVTVSNYLLLWHFGALVCTLWQIYMQQNLATSSEAQQLSIWLPVWHIRATRSKRKCRARAHARRVTRALRAGSQSKTLLSDCLWHAVQTWSSCYPDLSVVCHCGDKQAFNLRPMDEQISARRSKFYLRYCATESAVCHAISKWGSCIVWHSIAKDCFAVYNFTCLLLCHAVYVDYLYL